MSICVIHNSLINRLRSKRNSLRGICAMLLVCGVWRQCFEHIGTQTESHQTSRNFHPSPDLGVHLWTHQPLADTKYHHFPLKARLKIEVEKQRRTWYLDARCWKRIELWQKESERPLYISSIYSKCAILLLYWLAPLHRLGFRPGQNTRMWMQNARTQSRL